MLNPTKIRRDFPIFASHKKLVYLDSAASTEKPRQVIKAVSQFYEKGYANIHRGIYALSEEASSAYERVREKTAKFIGASNEEIIFTSGTTASINLAALGWGHANLGKSDEIILSEMEHHSNITPWQTIAAEKGCKIHFIKMKKDFTLNLAHYKKLLNAHTRIVAVTHVSNLLGTINPVREITELAHQFGAIVLIDGAQSVPHMRIDVKKIDCDFFAFSGHKMLGPSGVGVLYGKKSILKNMPPQITGGNTIEDVTKEKTTFKNPPDRFEAGTPNIEGVIGLGAAIDYLSALGMDAVHEYEQFITNYALQELAKVPEIKIYCPADPEKRAGVFAFALGKIHAHDVAYILDKKDIALRSGKHCAHPLMRELGQSSLVRASLYIYNTKSDIDKLIKALLKIKTILCNSSSPDYFSLKSHICDIIKK